MSEENLVVQLRSGLDNADEGEFGGIILTMNQAADKIEELEKELERQIGFKNDYRAAFEGACDQKEELKERVSALMDATDYAKNRLEHMATDSWYGDGRDLKRNIHGVFREYDEALKAKGLNNV